MPTVNDPAVVARRLEMSYGDIPGHLVLGLHLAQPGADAF